MVCNGFGENYLGDLCSLVFVNWPWWRGQVKGLFSENWPAFLTAFVECGRFEMALVVLSFMAGIVSWLLGS